MASGPAPAEVKALALAPAEGAPAVAATAENLASRRYPLARAAFAYYNRKPDAPLDAPVAEFLRYVLGPEGQRVAASGAYLTLEATNAREQSEKLR